MAGFRDEIKYPFDFNNIRIWRDRRECLTCGASVGEGIIAMATHYSECTGKQQFDNLMKIKDMPLSIEDKMDLVKNEMKINQ